MAATQAKKSLPAPRKITTYPIAEDPNGGAVFFYGNPDASSIVIFCAGYPDDHENGQVFCSRLAEENGTLVGLTCLAGFDDRPDKKWQTHKVGGYSFDEMSNAIRESVKVIRAESTNEKAKLTAIFHDWGVSIGMKWVNESLADENSDSPDDIVLFDVLGPMHKNYEKDFPKENFAKPSLYSSIITWYYRICFATSFAMQRYVSKYLGLLVLMTGTLTIKLLKIAPTLAIDDKVFEDRQVPLDPFRMIYMAYPYLSLFKEMFKGKIEDFAAMMCLPDDLKKTPVLYLYGTEKRIQFHEERAVLALQRESKENRSKSNAMAVEGAGHWLYIHQPDICLDEVKKFMAK